MREERGEGGFADAAFAREDEDFVPDAREAGCDERDVGVGAFWGRRADGLVRAAGAGGGEAGGFGFGPGAVFGFGGDEGGFLGEGAGEDGGDVGGGGGGGEGGHCCGWGRAGARGRGWVL